MEKKTSGFGLIMVIIAGICWGCISLFVKALGEMGFYSFQIMLVRTALAAVFLGFILLVYDKRQLRISPKDVWMFAGTGIVSLTFFSYCYFSTIVRAGAAIAVILLYTSPIFVMLLSAVFFKENITKKKLTALAFTFGGCVLMTGLAGGIRYDSKAIVMGLMSGFGYALYSIFAGYALKKYSPLTVTFYTLLFSAVSTVFLPGLKLSQVVIKLNTKSILLFVGNAFICTVVAYVTYTIGLSKMEKSKAAILVTVEPLVGTLIGIFIFKEPVTAIGVVGMLCVFFAVVLLA